MFYDTSFKYANANNSFGQSSSFFFSDCLYNSFGLLMSYSSLKVFPSILKGKSVFPVEQYYCLLTVNQKQIL